MLHLDVRVRRGEFLLQVRATLGEGVTGLFGPSGCGKSTLLAVLAGLLEPDLGRVEFRGETLVDTARGVFVPPWQRQVALVFQDGQLFPHLSVRENLLYGYQRRAPAERRFELVDAVDLLELSPLLSRRPAQLSGGERQRVALGRALLASPRLLLLDEPLAALDARLKAQILPFLVRLKREAGMPMVYVSHAREELDAVADTVLAMADGQLAAAATLSPHGEQHH